MSIKLYEEPDNHGSGWVIALVIIVLMLFVTAKCQAVNPTKVDTMLCKVECIKKIVEKSSTNGKSTKFYAVYSDEKTKFSEIIPISKNVVDYINICKQYSIKPYLGIKLNSYQNE